MNIIYETTKERGATILMPSSMVDSLNPSPALLALALASHGPAAPEPAPRPAELPARQAAGLAPRVGTAPFPASPETGTA
jgi:hypothetical protein